MTVFPICVNDDCWRYETHHATEAETSKHIPLIAYDNDRVMRWHNDYDTEYAATEAYYETVIYQFSSRRIFRGADSERL